MDKKYKEVTIKKTLQNPKDPYCGPITYCVLKGLTFLDVPKIHKRGKFSPLNAFFYPSFLKLDSNLVAYTEKVSSLNSIKIIKTEVDWKKLFQKYLSLAKDVLEVSKDRINYVVFDKKTLLSLLKSNLLGGHIIGIMVMDDLNKYRKIDGEFLIPHWVSVHGFKEGEVLVFNSYEGDSKWISEDSFLEEVWSCRKYGLPIQMVVSKT